MNQILSNDATVMKWNIKQIFGIFELEDDGNCSFFNVLRYRAQSANDNRNNENLFTFPCILQLVILIFKSIAISHLFLNSFLRKSRIPRDQWHNQTLAWTRVSADLLAVAVWILQIAITSVTSHVMMSYLIRRQYWLDDFIHKKKGQRNTYWNQLQTQSGYSRS